MIYEIGYGILGGAAWATLGAVNARKSGEALDTKKFFRSVLIGAALGAGAAATGASSIDAYATTGAAAMLTAVVDKVVSIVWKYLPFGK